MTLVVARQWRDRIAIVSDTMLTDLFKATGPKSADEATLITPRVLV